MVLEGAVGSTSTPTGASFSLFYTAPVTINNESRGFTDTQGLTPNKQEWQGKPGF